MICVQVYVMRDMSVRDVCVSVRVRVSVCECVCECTCCIRECM